ncbi:MAG: Peptidase and in kexin sedolisin [Gammaproteobacteria bacterium]|nr:Peptidase and in kexin sedolisin [Gammaproteobacteria bacterium]
MRRVRSFPHCALLAGLAATLSAHAGIAAERNPVRTPAAAEGDSAVQGVIVKFRATQTATAGQSASTTDQTVASLVGRTRLSLKQTRRIAGSMHLLRFAAQASGDTLEQTLARLRADSAVEYAEPDLRRYPHAVPDDPLYAGQTGQWYLQRATATPSAIDAEGAWDTTTGSAGIVIAAIDTGVRFDHPDLLRAGSAGRLLPGYDFISDPAVANDGDGRDADPSDPGDWVTSADVQSTSLKNCKVQDSSWHGTRVAGILGALTNNSTGIAGINWSGWLLPVRALGKCGGFDSDIIAGMLWAAGLHVDGVADNPYPAQIENLSLGSATTCSAAYSQVISELAAKGVLVVVSAGNEGGPVESPANCAGAAGIAGLRHAGTKVGYSSLGIQIALSAPAGNCGTSGTGACLYSLNTTANQGTTVPTTHSYTDQFTTNLGTSFSAPIVAGIAGLMKSLNGNLTPAQLIARLQEGATKPFPTTSDTGTPPICHVPTSSTDTSQTSECSCTTQTCGAGMANANGSVQAALRPIAAVAVPASALAGQNVTLNGAGSAAACRHSIASYSWTNLSTHGAVSNTSTATVVAPSSGSFQVQLTVTDEAGRTDAATVTVGAASATTSAPATAGSSACLAAVKLVTVAISPAAATVNAGGGTAAFAATIANAPDTAATWQVNGIVGGNATVGTISTNGLYTAPNAIPSPATVTITAVPAADPTISATAQVTVAAAASSHGGGALDLLTLCALASLLALLRTGSARRGPL